MAAACSPTSLQLRFALASSTRSPPRLSRRQLWTHTRTLRRRHETLSIRYESNADGFSGWSGTDGVGDGDGSGPSLGSDKKKWLGGSLGVGVAGIVLAVGVTFAAFSLRKPSNSGVKLMEPLTTQQEESLSADHNSENIGGNEGDEGQNTKREEASGREEGGTGTYKDSSSSFSEVENRVGDDSVDDTKIATYNNDPINQFSIHEELREELSFDDKSVETETVSNSNVLFETEVQNYSYVDSNIQDSDPVVGAVGLIYELEENQINVESTTLFASDTIPSDTSLDYEGEFHGSSHVQISNPNLISSALDEPVALNVPFSSPPSTVVETHIVSGYSAEKLTTSVENIEGSDVSQMLAEGHSLTLEVHRVTEGGSSGTSLSEPTLPLQSEQLTETRYETNRSTSVSPNTGASFSSAGIPAPSVVFSALQVLPGKVLIPAVVDQVQSQALAALQVLKVIEADVRPTDLCSRREYARWLVDASSTLSRNTISKVYPAMYIENVTELAFDDITPDDPDFAYIQGLAEAGLISSKLSRRDMLSSGDDDQGPLLFSPESPLSRQDLVTWKMALEKRNLPHADRKVLYELSGFIDADKIHPDACPALVGDLSAGEQGIIALAFGYTRLFQPDKPVTKAQAAIALAVGEASDTVSEELARIEAESMAENAVAAHNALVAQVEKEINASYERELSMERQKIDAVGKLAEEATRELEKLRAEREADSLALMKERAAIESEMEILSRLRGEVEEQLQSLMSNKVEILYEKERISKLRKEAEDESKEIDRLQYELEVERKALSMARAWAEDEARRAREQAKALEEARDRWEKHGIKVVVDEDLREESLATVTWVDTAKQFSVDETVSRAETLTDKLKAMAINLQGKSRATLDTIIQKITHLISSLKKWVSEVGNRAEDLRDRAVSKASGSVEKLQESAHELSSAVKESAKRVAGDCRDGVEKLTQKFVKT